MKSDSERSERRPPRVPTRFRATMKVGAEKHWCITVNMSRTGVLLMGDIPSPGVQNVHLALMTPTGDLQADVEARIVRVHKDEVANVTLVGLEFVKPDAQQKAAIEALFSRAIQEYDLRSLHGGSDFEDIVAEKIKKKMERQ